MVAVATVPTSVAVTEASSACGSVAKSTGWVPAAVAVAVGVQVAVAEVCGSWSASGCGSCTSLWDECCQRIRPLDRVVAAAPNLSIAFSDYLALWLGKPYRAQHNPVIAIYSNGVQPACNTPYNIVCNTALYNIVCNTAL